MPQNVDARNSTLTLVNGNLYNVQVTTARQGTAESPEHGTVVRSVISIDEHSSWTDDRQICVKAALFRDGTLASSITTHSKNILHGCRGGALLIGENAVGDAVWRVTLEGRTAGGVGDPFCSSFHRIVVMNNVGAEEAKRTHRMHVFYHFRASRPFPERFHHFLRGVWETLGY